VPCRHSPRLKALELHLRIASHSVSTWELRRSTTAGRLCCPWNHPGLFISPLLPTALLHLGKARQTKAPLLECFRTVLCIKSRQHLCGGRAVGRGKNSSVYYLCALSSSEAGWVSICLTRSCVLLLLEPAGTFGAQVSLCGVDLKGDSSTSDS